MKGENNMIKIYHPFKMVAEYKDGFEAEIGGYDEFDCMGKIVDLTGKHGSVTWYSGVNDDDYVDGEYVGRENFIES